MAPPLQNIDELNYQPTRNGGRAGQHIIRINKEWRICFRWQNGDVLDVEIVDYH